MEGIAKTMFPQKTFIGDSRLDFGRFLDALGEGFLSFSGLETGLKTKCFQGHLRDPDWHQKIKESAGPW